MQLPEPVDRADGALADPTEIARRCAEVMYADDLASRPLCSRVTVTAAADVVFLAPTRLGDELAAEGLERQRFGRSGTYDVTVRRADGSVVAEFRGNSRAIGGSLLFADTGSGEGTRS